MTVAPSDVVPPLRFGPSVLAVALGGALGTWARAGILELSTVPPAMIPRRVASSAHVLLMTSHWSGLIPWWLLSINTVGVFLATWLLAGPLRRRSPDDPVRLFAITGLLGGLTSYSTLIVDAADIKQVSILGAAATLMGAMVVAVGAAWTGYQVARR